LAHELGRFTDKTEIRLTYIMTSIHRWFIRVVEDKDVIDNKMELLSLTSSGLVSQIPITIAQFFVWLSRKILTVFMLAGSMLSRVFIRKSEFNADDCSVSLIGFEPFQSTLTKLEALTDASAEAHAQLQSQGNPNDNSLPDDFILLISMLIQRLGYPSDRERLDRVKQIVSKELFKSDKPASTLIGNFEEITKLATLRHYREVLDIRFKKNDLIPTVQFVGGPAPMQAPTEDGPNIF